MKIVYRLLVIILFCAVLISIIAYARGYRFDMETGSLTPTGILATSSTPKPAKVYVDGILKGVTDINLTLPPGNYKVEIKKEGYTDWSKQVNLKGEIVMSLNTVLFPRNPSLSPLTNLGIVKAVNLEQTDKILLFVQNDDIETDGIYIFEPTKRPLSFLEPLTPILYLKNLPDTVDLTTSSIYFSPDYQQALFEYDLEDTKKSYLLSLDRENTDLFETSASKDVLIDAWRAEKNQAITKILETFPKEFVKVASDSVQVISFSPDETKVLYKARKSAAFPLIIKPPMIGANQTPDERTIEPESIYLYDRKEDKNFKISLNLPAAPKVTPTRIPVRTIGTPTPTPEFADYAIDMELPIQWYYDSKHFIIKQEKEIVVIDYDDSNKRTVYSGPFEQNFYSVSTDGKLLILTNLNPLHNKFADLYEVGIQ